MFKIQDMECKISNLELKNYISITIHFDEFEYDPTRTGNHIELPKWVELNKHISYINIKNNNNK